MSNQIKTYRAESYGHGIYQIYEYDYEGHAYLACTHFYVKGRSAREKHERVAEKLCTTIDDILFM